MNFEPQVQRVEPGTNTAEAVRLVLAKRESGHSRLTAKDRYFKRKSEKARVEISVSAFDNVKELERGKYRAIITMAAMSLLWDGWKNKQTKKTNRQPRQDVLYTRRLGQEWFGISEATTSRALDDLTDRRLIILHEQGHFATRQGKRTGSTYRLSWLPAPKGEQRIWLYWSLFVSVPFRSLSVTAQAVLILLHIFHHRKSNRLTIPDTTMLVKYGVDRNTFADALKEILQTELLEYVEDNVYRFAWMSLQGQINYDWSKKYGRT